MNQFLNEISVWPKFAFFAYFIEVPVKKLLAKLIFILMYSALMQTYRAWKNENSSVIWGVTPCILVKVKRRFGGCYCAHLQGVRLRQQLCSLPVFCWFHAWP
jgi:hypothetical protein